MCCWEVEQAPLSWCGNLVLYTRTGYRAEDRASTPRWPSAVSDCGAWILPGSDHEERSDRNENVDYRTLGRSGCAVSSLCLGTMTFGVETDEAGSHEQLDRFVEAGGTLVDTADVYGGGQSEEIIGRWFASRPADVTERVVLATKGPVSHGSMSPTRSGSQPGI